MELCRDTFGNFNTSVFNLWTCALCYNYLFLKKNRSDAILESNWNKTYPLLVSRNGNFSAIADIDNPGQRRKICRTLEEQDCLRWQSCCQAAKMCCLRQSRVTLVSKNTCPRTWDGYGCFDDTAAGKTATITCPGFIEHGFVSGVTPESSNARFIYDRTFRPQSYAMKICTKNATWWRHPHTQKEWTNYAPCVNIKMYKTVVYVGVACCTISLILLVPATIIFLSIRQLRSQQRIRLHLSLFLSFILTSLFTLLWDLLVYSDLFEHPGYQTVMYKNSWGCRLLYFLKRYAVSANYCWMFCEGLYLHRLIVHVFRVPRYLLWYYLFGWGLPFVPVAIYAIIKSGIANHGCWIKQIDGYEWIIYIPNLICILANFLFLCSILRIMVSQLQTHPNEPSGYRRAIKATFVLVPLFGIQLFFVIYRPHSPASYQLIYEIISKIIADSQGAMITLIYCFCNGEVHAHIRARWHGCTGELQHRNNTLKTPNVSMSQYTAIATNQSRPSRDIVIGAGKGDNFVLDVQKRIIVNGNYNRQKHIDSNTDVQTHDFYRR